MIDGADVFRSFVGVMLYGMLCGTVTELGSAHKAALVQSMAA